MHIFIITGVSGSGKSTALAAFEDCGYYCVDNMPVALLPEFLGLPVENAYEIDGFCFVMDLREKGFLLRYRGILHSLSKKGYSFTIVFMKADESILVQRYSQTRRQHPLFRDRGLLDGIRTEKEKLEDLKKEADIVIDTSQANVHELKSQIFDIVHKTGRPTPLKITIMSFGFSNGIPRDADIIMDVRFLKNPYFVPELKDCTGLNQKVYDYVLTGETAQTFLQKIRDLIVFLTPLYKQEGKAYLTIAFGCTGGRHRSVAIARKIFEDVSKLETRVGIIHRDINVC